MTVLVPMPVKPGLNQEIENRMMTNLQELSMHGPRDLEVVIDHTAFPRHDEGENFFARLARMRQYMIDTYLKPEHHDVLWIDADIVSYPPDLYQQLRAVDDHIISPIVLIENTTQNYDTAGFRESYHNRSSMDPPWFGQPGPVVDLFSVGGCVLVPAWLHRVKGFYAQPDDDETWNTEWSSICQAGGGAKCDTRIKVYHANLPKYGEEWH